MAEHDDLHSVGVVVDEGQAFIRRHEDDLGVNTFASTVGGLTWGLMRAIAECPNCPGTFRTPVGKAYGYESAFDLMTCPQCRCTWKYTGATS
ncbi:MAG: hypothetical protein IT337_13685 [Thermomicrobiales bacterium]|nr:hypothetical protein [Thermomicrobiales bacterium]